MRVLLLDDNPQVLSSLSERISSLPEGAGMQIETFTTGSALLRAMTARHAPAQAVFIDIVLDKENGIETANRIRRMYPAVKIVFITGHVEYAPEIFDAAPIYMLAKPIQQDKLAAALRAIHDAVSEDEDDVVTFKCKNEWRTVRYSEIEYLESDHRKIHVHGDFGSFECYGRLADVFESFPDYFARCHMSYAVNMRRILTKATGEVQMLSGQVIPVAQRRRSEFQSAYVRQITRGNAFDGTGE